MAVQDGRKKELSVKGQCQDLNELFVTLAP